MNEMPLLDSANAKILSMLLTWLQPAEPAPGLSRVKAATLVAK